MCNMFQDQKLVVKFHRSTRLNLHQGMQGILNETANGWVIAFVAIPSVIFFPDWTLKQKSVAENHAVWGLHSELPIRLLCMKRDPSLTMAKECAVDPGRRCITLDDELMV